MMVMILIMKIILPAPDSYVKNTVPIKDVNSILMIVIIKMVDNFLD